MCPQSLEDPIFAERGALLRQGAALLSKRYSQHDTDTHTHTHRHSHTHTHTHTLNRLDAMDPALSRAAWANLAAARPESSENTTPALELLLAKIQLNSFNLPRPREEREGEDQGRGRQAFCVFGLAASMNHSCAPNACHYLDQTMTEHPALVVRAVRDIAAGEEVCIAYVELFQPRAARQEELRELYLFACACARCRDDSADSVDASLDAFRGGVPPSPDKVRLLVRLNAQAQEQRDLGNAGKALQLFRALIKEGEGVLHSRHHWLHFAHLGAARCLMRLGRRDEARGHWDTVVEQALRVYGVWPTTAGHEHMRVLAYAGSSDSARLEAEFAEHLATCRGIQCEQCRRHVVRELRCGRCDAAVYCSRECQVAAWRATHKALCKLK
jgi:hypothetical protein